MGTNFRPDGIGGGSWRAARVRNRATRAVALALVIALTAASLLPQPRTLAATPAPPLPSPPQVIQVSPRAWSGWWWPMYDGPGTGPHLFDPGGPMAKYDALAVSQGHPNPGTLPWSLANMRTSDPRNAWWGHCNGWAVAAILEPEPTAPREVGGIVFTVADQKGLLTSWYQGVGVKFQLGGQEGLSALLFHRAVQDWVVERGTPIIINAYNVQGNDYQVWNYPLVQARLAYTPDVAQPGVTHVAATVWLASDAVPANSVGTTLWPGEQGMTYTYRLTGNVSRPTGAEWEGPSAGPGTLDRPSLVWYPDPTWRYIPPLTPPGMDYATLMQITGRSSGGTAAAASARAASATVAPSTVVPAAVPFVVAAPATVASSATIRDRAARSLP